MITKSIGVGIASAAVILASFLAVTPAFAAVEVVENGGEPLVSYRDGGSWKSSIVVNPNDEFRSRVEIEVDGDHINAFSYDYIGDFTGRVCVPFPEKTQDGRYVIEFEQVGPEPEGQHDYVLKGYGKDGPSQSYNCPDSDELFSTTIEDRVTVDEDVTVGSSNDTTTGNSGTSGTGSSTEESRWEAILAGLQAILTKLQGGNTPAPTNNANCVIVTQNTFYPYGAYNFGVHSLQSALVAMGVMSNDQVATGPGFYGPKTSAAHATAKTLCANQ